jgi:hypothetical protein
MTEDQLFERLRELLMQHDFYYERGESRSARGKRAYDKGTTERMMIRRQLQTCATVNKERMTDVINEVLEKRALNDDMRLAMSWVSRWRVK